MTISRSITIVAAVAFVTFAAVTATSAQDAMAPAYSRSRMGANDWQFRGGGQNGGRYNGAYGYGFYQPFYFSPVIAGTWYARPYPYHFDYYRWRWGGPRPNNLTVDGPLSPANSPCASEATQSEAPTPPASQPKTPQPS